MSGGLAESVQTPPPTAPGAPGGRPPGVAVKILVVDDEPDLQLLIRQKFRRQIRGGEWDFLFAGNGQEALDILHGTRDVDVILTDINMPVMDGLTLLLRLGEMKTLHKAVIVSAYGDLGNIRTAMNRGAFDFVTKPIDFADLEITLTRTLEQLGLQRRAVEEHSQLQAIRQELDIASNIQQQILPHLFPTFARGNSIDVAARMTPALEVGGDFYDYFAIDSDRVGLVIGDVSGKGVSAAIFMAVSRTLIRAVGLTGMAAAPCLEYCNRLLVEDNPTSMFVTAFYAILDKRAGSIDYCNAGHNAPALVHADGRVELLDGPANIVLGAVEDAPFRGCSHQLTPGDGVMLYTDGVTEAETATGALYGTERLLNLLVAGGGSAGARDMIQSVFDDVLAHAAGAAQSDDVTALAVRWRPRSPDTPSGVRG